MGDHTSSVMTAIFSLQSVTLVFQTVIADEGPSYVHPIDKKILGDSIEGVRCLVKINAVSSCGSKYVAIKSNSFAED